MAETQPPHDSSTDPPKPPSPLRTLAASVAPGALSPVVTAGPQAVPVGVIPAVPVHPNHKKRVLTLLRWTVAIVGIVWVLSKISLHDRAVLLDAQHRPVVVTLRTPAGDNFTNVDVASPPSLAGFHARSELVNNADITHATLTDGRSVSVLAVQLSDDLRVARRVLIADSPSGAGKISPGRWVAPSELQGGYSNRTPYPLINLGIGGMVHRANPLYLWAALLVFPLTYLITSYRWDLLLQVLEIRMSLSRAFVLNMVGAFYNTFMPGSTGGDLLKAYYASKLTPHRMRAVMSVLVDRVIGLLALVLLGGVSAATQWHVPKCRQVALASAALFTFAGLSLLILYTPVLRRITGFDFVVRRLPMQRHVQAALETMELYRRRPLTSLWSLAVSVPVHGTVVTSAMLAGMAFGILPNHPAYYWVCVPVIVLSGSIPISPQGVGVMEGFAVLLLRPEGGTIAQAFALTMCIRVVAILWNLTGGLFVLRGGFHAPTEREQETMETDTTGIVTAGAAETAA